MGVENTGEYSVLTHDLAVTLSKLYHLDVALKGERAILGYCNPALLEEIEELFEVIACMEFDTVFGHLFQKGVHFLLEYRRCKFPAQGRSVELKVFEPAETMPPYVLEELGELRIGCGLTKLQAMIKLRFKLLGDPLIKLAEKDLE
ncbi:hypothetical protein MPH_01583 [Macrophomina phaseolina MS6]|uniref:Uncharacterized protein n=1 Tax=Macrophomina phaseolina (strain MS6) TaxID=1126212 RepID=K2S2E1_MACPH|nr:hypothetical protein MPH_01583 [Macrophomina phaseolina MS6]